jgi:hypothetical protein
METDRLLERSRHRGPEDESLNARFCATGHNSQLLPASFRDQSARLLIDAPLSQRP